MRLLHTMLRVGNLDRSIAFYTDILGMKLLRKHDYPDGEFTLAFVGFGDEGSHSVIDLTYNYGVMMSTQPARKFAQRAARLCVSRVR